MGEWSSYDRTILIVDGDRRFRQDAARALDRAGWNVLEAASGEEALAIAAKAEIALAVVEVRLIDISGYEVCRRLRETRGERLPILFVSHDRTDVQDRVAGLLVGADDYLAKPVAIDELIARIRRHLQRTSEPETSKETGLTAREREVLLLLVRGLGPVEIAEALAISPNTVATHVEHLYAKLGAHTRAQAVASAFRLGLVDTGAKAAAGIGSFS
ncbi:MAG TPA: response regulator [Gaiellaceae bacterium]|nr:response regulator [Gaiellaceae bacterium]